MKDNEILKKARQLVNEQAEDEGLWFQAEYITEQHLQNALRKLHAIIEDDSFMRKVLKT